MILLPFLPLSLSALLIKFTFQRLLMVLALLPDFGNGPSQQKQPEKKSRFNLGVIWKAMPKGIIALKLFQGIRENGKKF